MNGIVARKVKGVQHGRRIGCAAHLTPAALIALRCCLSGVLGVYSMGFTDERIVVVLSAAEPDDYSLGQRDGLALQADPGGRLSIETVTATVRAALGGPADREGPGSPTFKPAG